MFIAGVPIRDGIVPELVQRLRAANLHRTANRLETEHEAGTLLVGLEVDEREAIVRVLEECPPEFAELRAVLVQEHSWRRATGLG